MNEELRRMQQLAGIIDEVMSVNSQGQLEDSEVPKEWKKIKVDSNQDIEEDIEIESYIAPMEGWDTEHYDVVNIMKTPDIDPITEEPLESKYYVQTDVAFGDVENSEQYDSFEQAKIQAIRIMNNIKYDW
jgi:hypothetical protein